MSSENGLDRDQIEASLKRVLSSRWFKSSPNLHKILRYIVDEKFAGREEEIKAYTIAVDALGKPETFDPQTDPAIRIFVGRMRNALTDYYVKEGAADPIRISVPKGRYIPEFVVNELYESGISPPQRSKPFSWWVGVGSLATLVGVVAAFALTWFLMSDAETSGSDFETVSSLPMLEVFPLETTLENAELRKARGIQQQLIVDLAHFSSIRVREMEPSKTDGFSENPPNHTERTYQLKGVFLSKADTPNLNLTLTSGETGVVVWAKSISLPKNDAEFQNLLLDTSKAIASELVSETGVINSDGLARLKRRTDLLADDETSNYECLLLFFAYDKSKSESDEIAARGCITRLISAETEDSSIWASWALMQFLDWAKAGPVTEDLIGEALWSAQKAVSLDPTNAIAYEYLGSIQSALGDAEAAMASYQKGLSLNPSRPTLMFLIGWQDALQDNWDTAMPEIRRSVELMPSPPGYMRIPLAIDAFRRDDFETSLEEANRIIESGDQRGLVLAFVASIGLNDLDLIKAYAGELRNVKAFDPADPLKELRRSFSNPAVLEKYQEVLDNSATAWRNAS